MAEFKIELLTEENLSRLNIDKSSQSDFELFNDEDIENTEIKKDNKRNKKANSKGLINNNQSKNNLRKRNKID